MSWRGFWWLVCAVWVCLALADVLAYSTTEAVEAGQPFIYGLYVNRIQRAWGLVLFVLGCGIWVWLRHLWRVAHALGLQQLIIIGLAVGVLCGWTPLRGSAMPAVHLQSLEAAAPSSDVYRYQLYYQSYGITVSYCRHSVARCDSWGIQCQFIQQWQIGDFCLGQHAPIRLDANALLAWVRIDDEVVATYR
jgi:hypothetical protein